MCARYNIKDDCFDNCTRKASHVVSENIPSDKRTDFLTFMKKCREETAKKSAWLLGLGPSGVRPPAKPPDLPFPFGASNETKIITATTNSIEIPPAIPITVSTPDTPNPWIINAPQKANESAKTKAHREATLAASTQQLTQ